MRFGTGDRGGMGARTPLPGSPGMGTLTLFAVVRADVAFAAGDRGLLLSAHLGAKGAGLSKLREQGLVMAATYTSAGATFITVTHPLPRRIGAIELAAGVLLWWAVVAMPVSLFAPLTSHSDTS